MSLTTLPTREIRARRPVAWRNRGAATVTAGRRVSRRPVAAVAPAKIRPEKQKIRVAKGKTQRLVPFPEVSFDELRQAIRTAARAAGKVAKNAPPLVRALGALFTKAKLRGVGVRLRGGKIDLSGIPAGELAALGKVLASAKLPAEEA